MGFGVPAFLASMFRMYYSNIMFFWKLSPPKGSKFQRLSLSNWDDALRSGRQVGMQGLSPMVSLAFSAFRRPIHQGAMANQPLGAGAMANQPLGAALESW